MNRIFEIIIASLRSVLSADENALSRVGKLDEATLKEVYELSKKHDMAHLVGYALDKARLIDSSAEIKDKFANEQYLSVYRYENIKYETDRICALFDNENIPYIKLKGAVIRELYPEPWMRTSCDIDILVHKADLERATDSLVSAFGYRKKEKFEEHDVSLLSDSGVHLELHFSVTENIKTADPILEKAWDYAQRIDENRNEYRFAEEFFVFYHIMHMICHFLIGGCGIRPICDLYLLKSAKEYNEESVIELCDKAKTERFYLEMLRLTEAWFDSKEIDELSEKITEYIFLGGVYGTVSANIAVKQGAAGGKLGYLSKRIFASYDYLKRKYPSMKNKASLPFYQIRRWIDAINEQSFKRSIKELEMSNALDNASVEEIYWIMRELEVDKHIK